MSASIEAVSLVGRMLYNNQFSCQQFNIGYRMTPREKMRFLLALLPAGLNPSVLRRANPYHT